MMDNKLLYDYVNPKTNVRIKVLIPKEAESKYTEVVRDLFEVIKKIKEMGNGIYKDNLIDHE
jgi:hypothetical protein